MRHIISFRALWGVIFCWILLDIAMILWGHLLPPVLQFSGAKALARDSSTAFFILCVWLFLRESEPAKERR
jgi:glycerol-3-phosphate acyltransferase PlsY